jgi:hypothetical protein
MMQLLKEPSVIQQPLGRPFAVSFLALRRIAIQIMSEFERSIS